MMNGQFVQELLRISKVIHPQKTLSPRQTGHCLSLKVIWNSSSIMKIVLLYFTLSCFSFGMSSDGRAMLSDGEIGSKEGHLCM